MFTIHKHVFFFKCILVTSCYSLSWFGLYSSRWNWFCALSCRVWDLRFIFSRNALAMPTGLSLYCYICTMHNFPHERPNYKSTERTRLCIIYTSERKLHESRALATDWWTSLSCSLIVPQKTCFHWTSPPIQTEQGPLRGSSGSAWAWICLASLDSAQQLLRLLPLALHTVSQHILHKLSHFVFVRTPVLNHKTTSTWINRNKKKMVQQMPGQIILNEHNIGILDQ